MNSHRRKKRERIEKVEEILETWIKIDDRLHMAERDMAEEIIEALDELDALR